MSFETISLLLNWLEMGALLAILFRLSSTFNLIANTQREGRAAELGINNAFAGPCVASGSRSPIRAYRYRARGWTQRFVSPIAVKRTA
jgi:hypothetical protein